MEFDYSKDCFGIEKDSGTVEKRLFHPLHKLCVTTEATKFD